MSLGHLLRRSSFFPVSLVAVLFLTITIDALAAQLKEARVTQVVREVKLVPEQAAPRPATVSDEVRNGTAVRTGVESRAELTFTDQTLARLGANTIFSFDQGTRNLELGGGAMLLRVPKNAGGARIHTAAITAAITGTTILLEFHPDAYIKFIVLEGTGRIFRNDRIGESILLHAGQMLIVDPRGQGLPDPVEVDLERLIKTSLLINGFRPLPSDDLIARQINEQLSLKSEGELVDTNLVIFGRGTLVSLLDPTNTDILDQANANQTRQPNESPTPTPPPTPTPSKTGFPVVISQPNPFIISSNTTITTDPSITTDGQTAFGKIYRSAQEDGAISTYLFGSTSTFDQAINFDEHFADINLLPIAVFKFEGLRLTGDPTISTANNGPRNLALISVGDITTGAPGGVLTFGGLNSLLLATQNGSITLGSNVSFEGIPELAFYARGSGSNLTIDSAISGTNDFFFGAEGSILATGALSLTQTNNGSSVGFFSALTAGLDLITGNSLTIENDNSGGGVLALGGEITVDAGRDLIVNGGGDLALSILNNNGGQIGIGGSIEVRAGRNLSAGAVSLLIDNSAGGAIGGDAFISLGAFSLNADSLSAMIDNTGGTLGGNASIAFDISGNLITVGDATFKILRNNGETGESIAINTGSIDVGGAFTAGIMEGQSRVLFGDVNVTATGDITVGGDLLVDGTISAGGNILAGGVLSLPSLATAGGDITANGIFATALNAGGDITLVDPKGGQPSLFANIITAGGNLNLMNVASIQSDGSSSSGSVGSTPDPFTLSVAAIQSSGPTIPILFANGGDSDPTVANGNPGNGGIINLNINAAGLTIGSAGDLAAITANGGAFGTTATGGGDGGTINIVATGDVTLADGDITATTGTMPSSQFTRGDGGTVNITTPGAITVNSTIEVSSDDIDVSPFRRSATGGNISLTSTKAKAGVAINVSNTGQLLALLDQAAPGPGGKITILASGGGGNQIDVNGSVVADRGTVDIRHTGANGAVNLGGSGNNSAFLFGDIVKAGALGSNGTLTIGQGFISANNVLKLYAASANGTIHFIANSSIGGSNFTILAANTVTLDNGVTVNVIGAPADVYVGFNGQGVPNANYDARQGGNGSTNGMFSGAGVNTPQPIGNAPPFDGPPAASAVSH